MPTILRLLYGLLMTAMLVLALALTFALTSGPAAKAPVVVAVKGDRLPLARISNRWPVSEVVSAAPALPTLPVLPLQQPAPVTAAIPSALPEEPEEAPEARHRHRHEHDICRGKGRSYTRGGRSWRCNR